MVYQFIQILRLWSLIADHWSLITDHWSLIIGMRSEANSSVESHMKSNEDIWKYEVFTWLHMTLDWRIGLCCSKFCFEFLRRPDSLKSVVFILQKDDAGVLGTECTVHRCAPWIRLIVVSNIFTHWGIILVRCAPSMDNEGCEAN